MLNTDKIVAQELASLLVEHGVKRVFISPGSRNAPLIVAIARTPQLTTTVVIDERSAAFQAMGYGLIADEPVALVCTSGTALLNYAPAVAEAYYRKVPLIVISADRPMEWIDQDDSQTLRQPGAMSNYVKLSCDIPEITTENLRWYANRKINDALLAAITGRKAPVHINIQLDAPLGRITDAEPLRPRLIQLIEPREELSAGVIEGLATQIASPRRVMVIAGFYTPNPELNTALERLAAMPNVVVLTETISNLHSPQFISRIDTTLCCMDDETKAKLAPDVVITIGGALVSRFVKEYLRGCKNVQHWHVGIAHTTIDCFQRLTLRIELDAEDFFTRLAEVVDYGGNSDYAERWHKIAQRGAMRHDVYVERAPWSDLKAFATLLPMIPRKWNLQLSNGTPIRYAQLFGDQGQHRSDCNRGVSGIDGCTSTAIGAAMAYAEAPTLLITGDMSAQYDIGSLSSAAKEHRLKIIVMCNGGGGIFRFISATSSLPEVDEYLAIGGDLPMAALARAYGIAYFEAKNECELVAEFERFAAITDRCAMLCIHTDPNISAATLKGYFAKH